MMEMTRGGQKIGHCGCSVVGDEDEEIAWGRAATEGETGGPRARGGKGR